MSQDQHPAALQHACRHIHTQTHTYTPAPTYTHTHTYTRTHTYTHTCKSIKPSPSNPWRTPHQFTPCACGIFAIVSVLLISTTRGYTHTHTSLARTYPTDAASHTYTHTHTSLARTYPTDAASHTYTHTHTSIARTYPADAAFRHTHDGPPSRQLGSAPPPPPQLRAPLLSISDFAEQCVKPVVRLGLQALAAFILSQLTLTTSVLADNELGKVKEKVGVDGTCFVRKCAAETVQCGGDQTCLKGLSCLSRCKGDSACSTGCFAKYGSPKLDAVITCGFETHACVRVPGEVKKSAWTDDPARILPTKPFDHVDMKNFEGTWYKVMGLDTRYDCFDCQSNTFSAVNPNSKTGANSQTVPTGNPTIKMTALFRMPRPKAPGYYENIVTEDLIIESTGDQSSTATNSRIDETANPESAPAGLNAHETARPSLRSKGHLFGLTFWENWYVLGDSDGEVAPRNGISEDALLASNRNTNPSTKSPVKGKFENFLVPGASAEAPLLPDASYSNDDIRLKVIYYTGHTLEGTYKGAFVYASRPSLPPSVMAKATAMISAAGMDPARFCLIRNGCFAHGAVPGQAQSESQSETEAPAPWWFIGQRFFRATRQLAEQMAEWFEDPTITSEWLLQQQVRMVLNEPMQVSPFGGQIVPEALEAVPE